MWKLNRFLFQSGFYDQQICQTKLTPTKADIGSPLLDLSDRKPLSAIQRTLTIISFITNLLATFFFRFNSKIGYITIGFYLKDKICMDQINGSGGINVVNGLSKKIHGKGN